MQQTGNDRDVCQSLTTVGLKNTFGKLVQDSGFVSNE